MKAGGRVGCAAVATMLLLFLTACSASDDNSGPPPSDASGTTVGLSAEEVIVGVGDLVPGRGDVRACVADRLEAGPVVVAVGESVTAGSSAYVTIQGYVDECTSSAGQAEPFVELEGERSVEALTDEQKACLKAAFMASPRDVVDALLSEGLDAPAGSPAADAMAGIESGCGVEARTTAG